MPYDAATLRRLAATLRPEEWGLYPADLARRLNTAQQPDRGKGAAQDQTRRSRAELILGHGAIVDAGDMETLYALGK
jgi:hypothetical protein